MIGSNVVGIRSKNLPRCINVERSAPPLTDMCGKVALINSFYENSCSPDHLLKSWLIYSSDASSAWFRGEWQYSDDSTYSMPISSHFRA